MRPRGASTRHISRSAATRSGKKHQSTLAHHHIESAVCEGQFRGLALAPIDLWPQPPSHGQHALVEIEPGDVTARPNASSNLSRQDPGSTGDIEHPVVRCYARN